MDLMSIGKSAPGLRGHAASWLTNKLLLLFILLGISAFHFAVPKGSVSAVSAATRTNRIATHSQEQVVGKPLQPAIPAKIAEGEYVIFEQANGGFLGPVGEEISHFRESWTLWRVGKDQYRVEGVRQFETSAGQDRSDRFVVELSRDLTVLRMTEFAKLKWIRDSGPLSCDFLPVELRCSSGGSNPKQALQLRTHLGDPYGLLWPISPFSLTGITREVERDRFRTTPVDLLTIEQPNASNPVQTTILSGPLRYLGEEQIEAAGQKWLAHKFSIKVAMHPEFLVWTSSKGLLLAITIKHENKDYPEEWMRLQSFRSWADF